MEPVIKGTVENAQLKLAANIEVYISDTSGACIAITNLSPHCLANPDPVIDGILFNLAPPFNGQTGKTELVLGAYQPWVEPPLPPYNDPVLPEEINNYLKQSGLSQAGLNFVMPIMEEYQPHSNDTIDFEINIIKPGQSPGFRFSKKTFLNSPKDASGKFQAALSFKNLGPKCNQRAILGFNFSELTGFQKDTPHIESSNGAFSYDGYGVFDNSKGIKSSYYVNLYFDTQDSYDNQEYLIYDGLTTCGSAFGEIEYPNKSGLVEKLKFYSQKPTYVQLAFKYNLLATFSNVTLENTLNGTKKDNCSLIISCYYDETIKTEITLLKLIRPGQPDLTVFGKFKGYNRFLTAC